MEPHLSRETSSLPVFVTVATTEVAEFGTAPARASGPWTFTAFADQGVDTAPRDGTGFTNQYYKPDDTRRTMTPSTSMVDRIATTKPAFHLLAGDICYADPSGEGKPVRSTGGSKPATLETGYEIQVPLFLEEGTKVKVDTRSGDYLGRVK